MERSSISFRTCCSLSSRFVLPSSIHSFWRVPTRARRWVLGGLLWLGHSQPPLHGCLPPWTPWQQSVLHQRRFRLPNRVGPIVVQFTFSVAIAPIVTSVAR